MSKSSPKKRKDRKRHPGGMPRAGQAGIVAPARRFGRRARTALACAAVLTVAIAFAARALFVRSSHAVPLEPVTLSGADGVDPQFMAYAAPFVEAVRRTPDDPAAHAALGLVCSANNFWPQAQRCYENALRLGSRDPLVRYYLALALEQMDDYARARAMIEELVAEHPSFFPGWQRLGYARLERGEFAAAAAAFERIVAAAPNSPAGYAGLGACRVAARNHASAVVPLEKAVALDGKDRHARYLLGLAYRGVGRNEEARRELVAGEGSAPRYIADDWTPRLHEHNRTMSDQIATAIEQMQTGAPAQAVTILEEVRRWHPDNVQVLNNLASAYENAGNVARAREHLNRALALAPDDFPTWINLASTDIAEKHYADAVQRLDRAIQLAPDVGHPHLVRGRALMSLDRRDEALASLQTALRLDRTNVDTHAELFNLYMTLGRFEEARPHCAFVAERFPEHLSAQLQLCRVNLKLGLHDEALAALERAKRIDPNHPDVVAMAGRLAGAP